LFCFVLFFCGKGRNGLWFCRLGVEAFDYCGTLLLTREKGTFTIAPSQNTSQLKLPEHHAGFHGKVL
jgi:hypothetical protein